MSDQEDRMGSVLSQLEGGHISIGDAVKLVSVMKFPLPARKTAHQQQEDADLPELDMPEPGGFFDVSQAYTAGRITRRQYEALQQAVANAIKAGRTEQGHGQRQEEAEERPGHGEASVRPGTG